MTAVVLETAIRDALAKLDPKFAYAERFDEVSGKYDGLLWQKAPVGPTPQSALLVRPEIAVEQMRAAALPRPATIPAVTETPGSAIVSDPIQPISPPPSTSNEQPHRFFGSVEIDTMRSVRAFEAIVNAVVMEFQRTKGAKVKITLEIEAEAEDGFSNDDIGVIRDNTRQLKFKPESSGFE